ncbi:MAG: substrate-binding domain-containing protein [Prochloraceae cyanobacterium]|nr:substrate-binding domain-containing protein [Prochloraceae cyanobacterium]
MNRNSLLTALLAITTIIGLSSCAASSQSQTDSIQKKQEIRISGSGSSYRVFKKLAAAYEKNNPNTKIIFKPSNQASGGVRGVKDDILDIGVSSRELTAEELEGIEYRAIAEDALIMATHISVKEVTNLEAEELREIYTGEISNWKDLGGPDAKIILLDRSEDETAKILLRKQYLGKDLKVTPSASVLHKEKYVVDILQNTPYTIGPISLVQSLVEELPINRLSIDGIEPSIDNVRNRKYKMVRVIGFVWKEEPSTASSEFIDFVLSPEAAEEIEKAGYAAVRKTQ